MHSLLRQPNIKRQDLSPFLHIYDPQKSDKPDQWAKSESLKFDVGTLIFCLDTGSISTSGQFTVIPKTDSEADEMLRVKDLSIVFGKDEDRPLVINVTANAFEMRLLEVLLLEKARKAILDSKDLLLVMAQPKASLPNEVKAELDRFGQAYAQGGSRRKLATQADPTGKILLEPFSALLNAFGVNMSAINDKTEDVPDFGMLCQRLFAPEDKTAKAQDETYNDIANAYQTVTIDGQRPAIKSPAKSKTGRAQSQLSQSEQASLKAPVTVDKDTLSPAPLTTPISEAESQPESLSAQAVPSNHDSLSTAEDTEPISIEPDNFYSKLAAQIESLGDAAKSPSEQAKVLAKDLRERTQTILQEPGAIFREMMALLHKLETQVSKANKRLNARTQEIEHKLTSAFDQLLEGAIQECKDINAQVLVLCDEIGKDLETNSNTLTEKISNASQKAQDKIKELLSSTEADLDERKTRWVNELETLCQELHPSIKTLTASTSSVLQELVTHENEELADRLKHLFDRINEISDEQNEKLKDRFERFSNLVHEETATALLTIERSMSSMKRDIENSCERACEKLRINQSDFESSLYSTVRLSQVSLSQKARSLLSKELLPKLKERQAIIHNMIMEMTEALAGRSLSHTQSQVSAIETSLQSAKEQLNQLGQECLAKVESAGRREQTLLEELTTQTNVEIENDSLEVTSLLKEAEHTIKEGEAVCKNLAETFNLDADNELTGERKNLSDYMQAQRNLLKDLLETNLEGSMSRLEEQVGRLNGELLEKKKDETQKLRTLCDQGLSRVRDAVQEAFNAIQSAREKHMS